MDRTESLKVACCKCIAKYDIVEMLEPVAYMLPIKIVELLLAEFGIFQFGQFSSYFSMREDVQKLLTQKYKHLLQKVNGGKYKNWDYIQDTTELDYYCSQFWKVRVASALQETGIVQSGLISEFCVNIPHLVRHLHVNNVIRRKTVFKILPRFRNIQCISLTVDDFTKKWFLLADQWPNLRKIKLKIVKNDTLLPFVKEFLNAKRRKNKGIVLSFRVTTPTCGPGYFLNLMHALGDDIQGIEGLKLHNHKLNHGYNEFLTIYSRVNCMKEIKVWHFRDTANILGAIVRDAPQYTNEAHKISKLHVESSYFTRHNFYALHHWRFSRIECFNLSHMYIGLEGALIMAEYATFWPFVKRFILHDCYIPTTAFSWLLPAMVRGKGCEKLFELDLSLNECDTLEPLMKFLSSDNLIKLKIVRNFEIDGSLRIERCFLHELRKHPFVLLDMSFRQLKTADCFDIFFRCLCSAYDNQLNDVKINIRSSSAEFAKQYQIDLREVISKRVYEIISLGRANIETIDKITKITVNVNRIRPQY